MEDLRLLPVAAAPTSTSVPTVGVHDTLRHGFRSVRAEIAPAHPVQTIQEQYGVQRDRLEFAVQRLAYGSHMPVRIQMERHIVGLHQRLPVLPSSNLGMDILTGRDETLEFEDFLGDPQMQMGKHDVHTVMEHKLRL